MENQLANGVENAPRRYLYKSMGATESQLNKPVVGVIYSHNQTSPAHSDINKILDCVCQGIISAGASAALCSVMGAGETSLGGISGKYSLPAREIIADSVEAAAYGGGFDALVLVGSCDITVSGMLMAAARVNLPCILVSSGVSTTGSYKGKKMGESQILQAVYAAKAGLISAEELREMENQSCGIAGSGSEMNASNTMSCIAEVLGLSLPFNATLTKGCSRRYALAWQSGEEIVRALKQNITPKMILSFASITNALRFVMAAGGNPDAVMHLASLCRELDISDKLFNFDFIEGISAKTPQLVSLAPCGEHFMNDFNAAGGVTAVLKELQSAGLLDASALNRYGKPLSSLLKKFESSGHEIIKKASSPYNKKGSVAVLYGNIAEEGCLARRPLKNTAFAGTAKVFNSEEDAVLALTSKTVGEGDCIVVRYEGPKGAPGMREMRSVCAAISGMGLEDKTAVITDGRIGGTSRCLAVGYICPEAAEESNLALLQDGDKIEIDIVKGKISAEVSGKDFSLRRKRLKTRHTAASGYLLRYSENVLCANKGAILKNKF